MGIIIFVIPALSAAKDFSRSPPILSTLPVSCLLYTSVQGFLNWCEEKFNHILFGNVEVRRGFFKTWLSYLTLFGCNAQLNNKAASIDFSNYNDYSEFDNGIEIADILRGYFGGDYRLRSKCAKTPFADSDKFLKETVIIGDTQPIPVTACLLYTSYDFLVSRNGGIGRRAGLKILW